MRSVKQFLAIIISTLLCLPPVWAQTATQDPQATAALQQEVTIIIGREQVRFTAQQAGRELRLQIFNPAGEPIYDSGVTVETQINWQWRNGGGAALKSGLYAYTLSVRELSAETARVRRGQFIVDRAADRADHADRIWVTGGNANGLGAELAAAGDEDAAVAGTTVGGERTTEGRGEGVSRVGGDRSIEAEAKEQTTAARIAAAVAVTAGTTGRIAKFTSATEVGNSVLTELNSNIGIGITNPLTKLHISAAAGDILPPRLQSSGTTSFAAGWDFYHGTTGKGYVGVPGAASSLAPGELLVYAAEGTKTSLWAGRQRGLTVDTNGSVGIGTASPRAGYRLHVEGTSFFNIGNGGEITFGTPNAETGMTVVRGAGRADLRFDGSTFKLLAGPVGGPPSSANGLAVNLAGNVGIGTASPRADFKLHVVGGNNNGIGGYSTTGVGVYGESAQFNAVRGIGRNVNHGAVVGVHESGGIAMYGTSAGTGVQGDSTSAGGVGGYFRNTAGGVALVAEGLARVSVLQITGGADFAENFDVNVAEAGEAAKVEAGMVVSIDPTNPGKLSLSTRAYDRRVAGIISGAGGVQPGMMMSQAGTLADGKHPVALSGRVYCWVDASAGAVEPGDLLTTAATPGHAMKVGDPLKAQGAIIGKAMTGLKEGKGLVLVLVTLQ